MKKSLRVMPVAILHSDFFLLPFLDFHFAVRTRNPDLFRPWRGCRLPVYRATDDFSHLGEPPIRAGATIQE